ncbi:MAG: DUF692 family protein [Nitrospirales bacterium]|nr:DUF692 domain-containing protein [Nitrospirales bacterium]
MTDFSHAFHARARRIPFLGVGLSVDIYSPNVLDLSAALNRHHLSVGYLEIFHAHAQALRTVRERLPAISMVYHAEGLWFTQPNWHESSLGAIRLESIARELELLDAWWMNQECASKEIAGFPFGTYVPPLFTEESARLTAQQVWKAQEMLDARQWGKQASPLVLLEVPPLTYFAVGDLSYAEFFQQVTHWAPCGLVLDLGHVWTAFRYSRAWTTQTFEDFFDAFLEVFPLERVVQIHMAGLACHPTVTVNTKQSFGGGSPLWIDSHADPIPQELFWALGKVLLEDRLYHLKGLALEVDNKEISLICRELKRVQEQFGGNLDRIRDRQSVAWECAIGNDWFQPEIEEGNSLLFDCPELASQYVEYVSLLSGETSEKLTDMLAISSEVKEGIHVYASQYLSHEILCWGGDISDMFPRSCEALKRDGLRLEQFPEFWFARPWTGEELEYDFFLMKINRFVEYIRFVLPQGVPVAVQEAMGLREGYAWSCREIGLSEEVA